MDRTIRPTSLAAYAKVLASGLVVRRRWEAFECLCCEGPLTAQEVCHSTKRSGMWKRLSELESMGVVEVIGNKKCSITGHDVMAWDVVGDPEIKVLPTRPKTKMEVAYQALLAACKDMAACDANEEDWGKLEWAEEVQHAIEKAQAAIILAESAD